jgi:hypothetical protein
MSRRASANFYMPYGTAHFELVTDLRARTLAAPLAAPGNAGTPLQTAADDNPWLNQEYKRLSDAALLEDLMAHAGEGPITSDMFVEI